VSDRSLSRLGRAVAVCAFLGTACSGSDGPSGPGGGGGGGGSIAVSLSAASLSLNQGAGGQLTVTIARAGGFAGAVAVAAQNVPTGVTVSPSPATVAAGSTTAALTIQAAAGAAVGTTSITIRASAAGVSDATATLSLTIAAAPAGGFTLVVNPGTLTINRGGGGQVAVNITRAAPFTGPVALTATGLPNGVTASFDPANAAGAASTLTLTAAAGAATGTTTITVRGTGTGVAEQTATLSLTVQAPVGGAGTWRVCAFDAIIWFAFQDGSGPWTRVNPVNNSYTFNFASGRGAIAYVEPEQAGGFTTTVFFGSREELTSQGELRCESAKLGSKRINGTVAGVGANEQAWIAMGGAFALAPPAIGNAFTLNNVFDGPVDLIAARVEQTIAGPVITNTPRRLILRRNLNPANNATLPVLDFGAAEAFDPVARTVTINNLGGDAALASTWFSTANGFVNTFYYTGSAQATNQLPWYGIPADRQAAADLHALSVSALPPGVPTHGRSVVQYFRPAENRTVTLGPNLNAPAISVVATSPYVRVRAQVDLQPEYRQSIGISYSQGQLGTLRTVALQAHAGFIGAGAAVEIVIPDFTAADGFNPDWGLRSVQTQWTVSGSGWTGPGGNVTVPVVDGGVVSAAHRTGTINP
jgi:hypothetical protein